MIEEDIEEIVLKFEKELFKYLSVSNWQERYFVLEVNQDYFESINKYLKDNKKSKWTFVSTVNNIEPLWRAERIYHNNYNCTLRVRVDNRVSEDKIIKLWHTISLI